MTSQSTYGDDDVSSKLDRVDNGIEGDSALIISMARKRFGKILAVKDISVSVGSGEILALLGPNGAGKTTLVNCVLGLYRLSSGTAKIIGFDILRQQDQVYRHVGVCPQREILWPDLTCEEHLLFYARLKGVNPRDEKEVVKQCLEQVELAPERRKLSKQLSGGQKRRLAIAIALVARPAVVFLDEPTTGIASQGIANDRFGSKRKKEFVEGYQKSERIAQYVHHINYAFNVSSPLKVLTAGPKQTIWLIESESWFKDHSNALAQEYILNDYMAKATSSL